MSDVTRRDAVKLVAGLAVGAGALAAREAQSQEPKRVADLPPPKPPADTMLARALASPQGFLFAEQIVSKSDPAFDVVVTSARDLEGKPDRVVIRTGTMRIFRADAGVDGFTKRGGWYWQCGDTQGKSQFEVPGALVMAVREKDGTVRWYSLGKDYRC
jgi:hypothetical protein